MNSYERLMNRLQGAPVDRAPNLCIMMGFAARYAGVPYHDFCLCPEKMVEANLKVREDFDLDIVTVMSDPYGEAMDYGMRVEFPPDDQPRALAPLLQGEPSAAQLPFLTLAQTTRMKDRVRTIRLYAEKLKGECPIAGWVEGVVAEYCDLRDINYAMMDMADEEPFLDDILERLCRQAIVYAEAQVDAGADIIGIGDAACSLLGPRLYGRYGLPYEKRIIDAVHAKGAKVKLHICGDIGPLLEQIAALHADIVDIDWMVDFERATGLLHGVSAVCGNFDPVEVLLRGTQQEVEQAVRHCLAVGNETTLISGGCETPRDTPHGNLRAVARALRQ